MAHEAQRAFCTAVKRRFPELFSGSLVVDIGALDINGNNRYLFERSLYLGVDLAPGPNVDLACMGHQLALPDASLDVVISTEAFEHDAHWTETLANAVRMLKPGGLLLFSCATTGRPEHGTRRSQPEDAPLLGQAGLWPDYYRNLEAADIAGVLDLPAIFAEHEFGADQTVHDLYFWGIKRGERVRRADYSFLAPTGHKSDPRLYYAVDGEGFGEDRAIVPSQFFDEAGFTEMVWRLPAGTTRVRIDPTSIPAIFALDRIIGRDRDRRTVLAMDGADGFAGIILDPDSRLLHPGQEWIVLAPGDDCRIEFVPPPAGIASVDELTLRLRLITCADPVSPQAAAGMGTVVASLVAAGARADAAEASVRDARSAIAAALVQADGARLEMAVERERTAAADERARTAEAAAKDGADRVDLAVLRQLAAEGQALEASARATAAEAAAKVADAARVQATAAAFHADQRAASADQHARQAIEQAQAAVAARLGAEALQSAAEASRQQTEAALGTCERAAAETARNLADFRQRLDTLSAAHALLQADQARILHSRSWRLTAPLRWLGHLIRRK